MKGTQLFGLGKDETMLILISDAFVPSLADKLKRLGEVTDDKDRLSLSLKIFGWNYVPRKKSVLT